MPERNERVHGEPGSWSQAGSRRTFFKLLGATGVALSIPTILTACGNGDDNITQPGGSVTLDFSSDVGVLNYAYALEQLEAAFYSQAVSTPAGDLMGDDLSILSDIRDHEIAHREFFKAALGSSAIGALEVDFSTVDFDSRASVLGTAKAFEDLGVSAYNGAGKLLTDPALLLEAGKIVSVEARHAAAIRDLLNPGSSDFAGGDVVDSSGLGKARDPNTVLSTAAPFVRTTINVQNLS